MTDTTTHMVLNHPRHRWWAWVGAAFGVVTLVVISLASLIPATVVAEKENQRLNKEEPAPYAQVPASAESVNARVEFGDLPDDVERFVPDGAFFFVTVTAPEQSLLSWFAGRGDPAYELLTKEDKFGAQTPSQRRAAALQQMRTASQEAQFVALTAAGYEPEISLGQVVVGEVLCRTVGEDGTCEEYFPSGDLIEPQDTILEADGVPLNSVEDLVAVLADKQPGDTADLLIDRPDAGELNLTVELAASPDEPDRTIVGFRPFDTRVS